MQVKRSAYLVAEGAIVMKSSSISRRTFVKSAAAAVAAVSAGSILSACSGENTAADADASSADGAAEGDVENDMSADVADASGTVVAGGVLVAYFSATGNTERIADIIAAHTGSDVFAIEPAVPYSTEDLGYNNEDSRASRERADQNRAVELATATPPSFESYDTVLLGYPIWWGGAGFPVETFARENDFTGKVVITFCTSGSSPIGSSGDDLAALAGSGEWLQGERFAGGASESDVIAWVDELDL